MRNIEIRAVEKALAEERERLWKLRRAAHGAEYRQAIRVRDAQQRVAIQDARAKANPPRTGALLIEIAEYVRSGWKLSGDARVYLADAIIGAVRDPDNAGSAFGLVAVRHRQRSDKTLLRQMLMAEAVYRDGGPVNAAGKDSAIDRVAKSFCVSARSVERAWKRHGAAVKEYADRK